MTAPASLKQLVTNDAECPVCNEVAALCWCGTLQIKCAIPTGGTNEAEDFTAGYFYSRGKNRFDNQPELLNAGPTWELFVQAVWQDKSAEKGSTFIAAPFIEGMHNNRHKFPHVARWRQKHLVGRRRWMPFDIDEMADKAVLDKLVEYLDGRYQALIYTTDSSSEESPRVRMLVDASRAMKYDESVAVGHILETEIVAALGSEHIKFDKSVYKGEQPCYLPTVRAKRFDVQGSPLDVDALMARCKDGQKASASGTVSGDGDRPLIQSRHDDVDLDGLRWMLGQLGKEYFDDYAKWRDVGFCIHHQFRGTNEEPDALQVWIDWSAQSSLFVSGECEKRWEDAQTDHAGGVMTVGSLKSWVGLDKWRGYRAERKAAEFDGPELALLDEIALVKMGSKVAVLMLDKESDDVIDTMGVQGARDYFAPRQVLVPGEGGRPPRLMPEFTVWLKHPQRRTLRGLEFAPDGKIRAGYFNLWRGFAVAPAKGNCERILQHIREVICAGKEEYYIWLIRWMAHAVQCPTDKPGTAIVLRGREGTGKNVFAEAFGELFGPAFFKASRMDHLVGKFNKHLAGRLVVFSNEAVWGGNKADEGALKDLITEREQTVEPKGLDAFQVKDYSRHILATNESWAVPAGMDARRWFVLDVSDLRMGDYAYFGAIKQELQDGGRAALLYYLMNLDLTDFNVRNAPLTEGLLDQKERSLSSVGQWWFHVLQDGFSGVGLLAHEELTDADGGVVPRQSLFEDYRRFAMETGHGKYLSTPNLFGVELRKMLPALKDHRPREAGRRVRCYGLPPLSECRAAFDSFMRQPRNWLAGDDPD